MKHWFGRAVLLATTACLPLAARAAQTYDVFEKSIDELEAAQASGQVTAHALVEAYLARIAAYSDAGPKLNAIVTLNPKALAEADALDRERAARKLHGPLHGIPILVKDNYDTVDMPTSGGTLALATLQPTADAFQVRRLRAAGAIILGKTAMHELASGVTTVSSLTGVSRNPYDPARSPGGSSGGTGASVGASFATAGMGTDTCGSIRIPSSYQNLFGLRETRGLASRAGILPLSSTQDVGGPLARSVTDLATMLDATVGADPADAITMTSAGHIPKSYRDSLRADGLKGARIGVLRSLFGDAPEDREVTGVVNAALAKMKEQGAEVMDVKIPGLDDLMRDSSVILYEFKYELADYLAHHPGAPVKSLGEILEHGMEYDALDARLHERDAPEKRDDEAYRRAQVKQRALRDLTLALMETYRLDALVYPTSQRKPPLIGDEAGGTGTCQLSAQTGLPALAAPAGFNRDGLPVGMEFLGAMFSEPTLIKIAYGWEQAAKPRHAPFSTPALVDGHAPPPVAIEAKIAAARTGAPSANVKLTYDVTTGTLHYAAAANDLGEDKVVALTLQRGEAGKTGPVVAVLMTQGKTSADATLTLRSRDRDDLAAGRFYLALYTKGAPLGAGRAQVLLPAGPEQ